MDAEEIYYQILDLVERYYDVGERADEHLAEAARAIANQK